MILSASAVEFAPAASLQWSEQLDADTVDWFHNNGGLSCKNGDHFRQTLLSRGGSAEAMELFRNFRRRDPVIEPLLGTGCPPCPGLRLGWAQRLR